MDIVKYRKAKEEMGLTFEELSAKSGVKLSTLKEIFRGATPSPRIDTIQKIERALNLSTISEDEFNTGMRDYVVRNLTPIEDEYLSKFRELGEKKGETTQSSVISIIDAMLKA